MTSTWSNTPLYKKAGLIIIIHLWWASVLAQSKQFYVSTSGSDVGKGSLSDPYKTINKAKLAARNYNRISNIDIIVRGGTYYLDSPIALEEDDAGRNGFKVRYRANAKEKVVLSGGRVVPHIWMPDKNNIWKADLSRVNTANIIFRQLWVDGRKVPRGRCGFEITEESAQRRDDPNSLDFSASTATGKAILSAAHKEDLEIWTYWSWMANIVKVATITGNHITTRIETPYFVGFAPSADKPQKNFGIENAYEFIDEPGEWFYDKRTRYLYYYPTNGSNPNNSEVIFPVLEKIITAKNVSNVEFSGFTFSHATWLYPNQYGYISAQGSIYVQYVPGKGNVAHATTDANIEFTHCSQITISNNTFAHLGAEAICFQNTSVSNQITNNRFTDIAGTAIRLGDGRNYDITDPQKATRNNIISNNIISNAANEYRTNCGIWLGYVNHNSVINNKLSNLPYTGISTGYPISPSSTVTVLGANTITGNDISDVVNTLRDGGAIYNFGTNTGRSIIKNNRIYDIDVMRARDIGGIYLDEGSSDFEVSNNYINLQRNSTFTNAANLPTILFVNNTAPSGSP